MDGSYWAMGAPGKFEAFGAVECYAVPSHAIGMGGRGPTFMIKLADGLWHYAHDSRGSYYAAAQGYDAPNGAIAWLYNVQTVAAVSIENAQAVLSQATTHKRLVDAELAAAIHKLHQPAKTHTLRGTFHPGETFYDDTCAG